MAAKYGHLINRWTVAAVAALAVMAALLATTLTAGAQDRPPVIPDAQTIFDYAENGTGPIATYRATDPENKPVFWTLGGADAADFTIVNGALRFKSPPNFEVPTDRTNDEDGSGVRAPANEGAGNNIYKVTVRFGAGGEDGTPGEPTDTPADEYDGDDLGEVELTINVTNVNEPGMLVISPMQPQEGTELTAILTDEDNVAPGTGEWQWARADSMTGTFADIPSNSGDMTYRPTMDDLGKYVKVTVDYVDRAGPEVRTVQAVSAYRVRKDTNTSNQDPMFPDQSTLTGIVPGTIEAPERGVTDRFIPEIAAAGTRVGAPVTAFDDKTDIEVITYSLRDADGSTSPNGVASDDDGNTDTPRHNDGHAASFDIDAKTGQITVGASAMLDADGTDGAGDGATNPYSVVVRAVDGDGDTQNIDVDIHVLMYHEPPVIDRVYQPDRVGEGHSVGDRVPTEISHWEDDRTPRSPAIRLDADLESGVLDYSGVAPVLKPLGTGGAHLIEAATYYATDPDGVTDFCWTLEGDDAGMFRFQRVAAAPECDSIGPSATLRFQSGPDFEKRRDKDEDNVYEVTIVVEDGTVDMNRNPHRDELPVTVKVINSTEDNEPGEVKFSNRVPEVAIALTATHEDDDGPVTEREWQWYRSVGSAEYPAMCSTIATITTDNERYFIDAHPGLVDTADIAWQEIDGATFATYTPGYDEDSGGTSTTNSETGEVTWTGGDIGVTISTDDEGNKAYSNWTSPRCLRATVTYRDAVDRTHAEPDDGATLDVDETLEGTFQQTEYPVKPIDEENDAPEFLDPDDKAVSVYRADDIEDIGENTTPSGADAGYTLLIKDAPDATDLAASDPMAGEDDDSGLTPAGPGADILTYSLSGADKDDFVIVGSIDNPTSYDPDGSGPVGAIDEQGALVFRYPPKLDYETQREYRVTVTATDPSGENDSVTVNVNITNVNEGPGWDKKPGKPAYAENDTANVATYLAEDPEKSGVTYSLVTAPGAVAGTKVDPATGVPASDLEVGVGEFEDHDLFEISSTRGTLRFKESPNYEDPKDVATAADVAAAGDNMYQVVVKAEVADDQNPRHATIQWVTVTVINVNEAPVFFETTDTLEISENPDDPEKEATAERGELYLLNRGVGKPAANLPVAPDLDLGIPVVAVDDDNTWTAENYLGGTGTRETRPFQLIDGLTYELMGADAGLFDIVPATGQILTKEKLDYEAKNTHTVRVKATDPWGLWDTIDVTINVTDVDEAPVSGLLTLTGNESHTYAENGADTTLGIYKFSGARTGTPAWALEGADANYFILERSSSTSRTLKFEESPNYEMPRGQAVSDANTYPYMVTVKVSAGNEMKTRDVTVTVTNVEEPGMVGLSSTGGKVGTPLTAALTDDDIVMGPIEWLWSRVDPATGNSTPITGARSSSYTPVAADVDNLLMVTASYTDGTGSGQSASDSITTPVADANAAPEFAAAMATYEVAENMPSGTLVGIPVTATDPNGDNLTYRVSGVDAASFVVTVNEGQLRTSTRFDYEAKSSYSVAITVTDPEGLSGSIAVTVNVTNVDEGGMVGVSPTRPSVGTPITASVTDPDSAPTGMTYQWSYSTAMGGPFTPYPAETTARFTPADADVGRYLRVTVSYNDVHGAQAENATTDMVVMSNVAPAFSSEAATRSVAENTAARMNIGEPVMATDYDNDTLTYTLSGTDAGSFDIGMSTGQLMTKAALDYETKMSYMVTVTATDPEGASDSIMVTIMVTDVDEGDPADPVVARYDTNGTPGIQKDEVITAINDYLFGTGDDAPSKAEVITLINLYLFG